LTIKFTQHTPDRSGRAAQILRPLHRLIAPAGCPAKTPADSKALIKLTQPCRLPNLFSCQTSSPPDTAGDPAWAGF
jgi:hypothetical protein